MNESYMDFDQSKEASSPARKNSFWTQWTQFWRPRDSAVALPPTRRRERPDGDRRLRRKALRCQSVLRSSDLASWAEVQSTRSTTQDSSKKNHLEWNSELLKHLQVGVNILISWNLGVGLN